MRHNRCYRWVLLLVLVLGPLMTVGCSQGPSHLMEEANDALSREQVDRAVVFLQEIWAKYPSSSLAPKALLRLAEIERVVHNNPSGAVTMLKKILSKYPDSPEAKEVWVILGEIYEKSLHDPREALAIYRKGLESGGDQLPLLEGSVRTLITLGNIEEAEELTQRVLNTPGNEGRRLSLLLGDLFRAKGFFGDAQRCYSHVCKENEKDDICKEAKLAMALLLEETGHRKQGIVILEELQKEGFKPEVVNKELDHMRRRLKEIGY